MLHAARPAARAIHLRAIAANQEECPRSFARADLQQWLSEYGCAATVAEVAQGADPLPNLGLTSPSGPRTCLKIALVLWDCASPSSEHLANVALQLGGGIESWNT